MLDPKVQGVSDPEAGPVSRYGGGKIELPERRSPLTDGSPERGRAHAIEIKLENAVLPGLGDDHPVPPRRPNPSAG